MSYLRMELFKNNVVAPHHRFWDEYYMYKKQFIRIARTCTLCTKCTS